MIEEPPLITIHPEQGRPTTEQIAELAQHPTGVLCDAMGGRGALPRDVKPVAPGRLPSRVAGAALTADCGAEDVLALLAALTEVQAGDVLVVSTQGWQGCASFGDRVCGMARNGGAAGIVSEGPARDLEGIVAAGLPAFCAGITPASPFNKGPGAVGGPVTIGGVRVDRGDAIVADADGVVVVPLAQVEAVIETAGRMAGLEAALDAEVREGLSAPGWVQELVSSDRTRRL